MVAMVINIDRLATFDEIGCLLISIHKIPHHSYIPTGVEDEHLII